MASALAKIPEPMDQIPHFGLIEGINSRFYLFQDVTPNGFDFKPKTRPSGKIVGGIKGRCPHAINGYLKQRSVIKKHSQTFDTIKFDPVVKMMAPLPWEIKGERVVQVSSQDFMIPSLWFKTLETLSSPNYSQVLDINSQRLNYIIQALEQTNLQPLVLYGIYEAHYSLVAEIIALSKNSPRTLILVTSCKLPNVATIETKLPELIGLNELVTLPLEHIGVRLIDKFINGGTLPWQE